MGTSTSPALRVMVVDDEEPARDELCYQLGQLGNVEVVVQVGNGIDALAALARHTPDLVFLDIQMPGLTGFEVAKRLLAEVADPPAMVFVTAFDDYAIEAFEVNAVDYLLKPVDTKRLDQALQRGRQRRDAAQSEAGTESVRVQLDRLTKMMESHPLNQPNQLALRVDDRLILIQTDEIIYASLVNDSINIVTGRVGGTSNYRTLDELHGRLDPEIFWRVHRSHLVNINKIKEIVPWFSRNYILRMKDAKATEIPVSRSQTKRLREHLKL